MYLFSWVESPSERYPPSVGGGGLLRRPGRVVRVVVGIEVSARERTLRCFLGRGAVHTTGAVLLPLSWGTMRGVVGS